jgi:hypothetical protein
MAVGLNMTEIEIPIFQRNALSGRIADENTLRRQVLALETEQDAQGCIISWQLTSRDARVKLQDLYLMKET